MTDQIQITQEEYDYVDSLVSFWTVDYIKKILNIDPQVLKGVLEVRYEELTKGDLDETSK